MYGTVARVHLKSGMEAQLYELANQSQSRRVPGWVATYVYRMDADSNEYFMAIVFKSREAYIANAQQPEQDADYRRLRKLLVADPEWHDGALVFALQSWEHVGA